MAVRSVVMVKWQWMVEGLLVGLATWSWLVEKPLDELVVPWVVW